MDIGLLIAEGEYSDLGGCMWTKHYSEENNGFEYWTNSETPDIWYSATQFRDRVVVDQMKRNTQADALERAGRSGAFGTRAQSTLLTMAQMMRQGSLKEFLDSNGCKW